MKPKRNTILARWLREASSEQRAQVAQRAGTSENYLWQLAACRRESKVALAFRIEDATAEIGPFTVHARDLAMMCSIEGLDG